MSRVSELKKLFDNNKSAVLTPEQHALALRTKERDQKEAAAIAKSRAARYNLRLRSMELDTAKKEHPPTSPIIASAPSPRPAGSLYNNNRKSMKLQNLAKIEASQALVAAAMGDYANPQTVVEAVDLAAKTVDEAFSSPPTTAAGEEEVVVAQPVVVEEEVASSPADALQEGAAFEMTELVKALEEDDSDAINKAVVVEFLQEHDPAKIGEVDEMLHSHVGEEEKLMSELADQYADPVQVEIQATTKAIEEPTPPPPPQVEEEEEEEVVVDVVEAQRREALRVKQEEEAKLAAMDDQEKVLYMDKLNAQAKHNADKDRMLKAQLNVYGSGGAAALLSGGRGRGKARKTPQQEYIVNGAYQGGKWEVNQ